MTQALKGKLALVTGASRGIGAAIAARLARDGASVIVHYASSPARADEVVKAIRDAGGEAEAVGANLSKSEGMKTLIDSLNGVFGGKFDGRLDILVNNAGTVEYGPFLESSDTSYDTHFNLNVRAPIELAKDAAKRMIKTGWGRIINVGSAFGEAAPLPGVTLYIASKFAASWLHARSIARTRKIWCDGQRGPAWSDRHRTGSPAWNGSPRHDDETRQRWPFWQTRRNRGGRSVPG